MHLKVFFGLFLVAQLGCSKEEILALSPQIDVSPERLDFGWAIVGQENRLTLTLKNSGAAVLELKNIRIEPASATEFFADPHPRALMPGQTAEFAVVFVPLTPRAIYSARLVITSNDPLREEVEIPLDGRGGYREIKVVPREIDFGVVDEGAGYQREIIIENVGEEALEISSLTWTSTSTDMKPDHALASSLSIAARTSTSVFLSYHPTDLYGDTGTFHIRSNDEREPEIEIPVRGYGNLAPIAMAWGCHTVFSQVGCSPEARGRRFTMSVGQRTGLDGRESYDPEGKTISSFRWTIVSAPQNSNGLVFHTTDDITLRNRATGDFEISTVGRYDLRLIVTDERGVESFDSPESHILLAPKDLQILLRWTIAADVDLHVVAPGGQLGDYGSGEIGTSTGTDCSWANRGPNWNDISTRLDDPRLDIDAVSSRGPEITSINQPQSNGDYRIFAHYCDSHSVGESVALTMELYVEGDLIETVSSADLGVTLDSRQAWEIGTVTWNPNAIPKAAFLAPRTANVFMAPQLCLSN